MPGDLEHADSDAASIDVANETGSVPAVQETDPERIAQLLWNEGKADEAIEYLEKIIAAERARRGEVPAAASAVPALLEPADDEDEETVLEPVSGWRERHRAALTPVEFNAFGNSVRTIDITPKADDAILPPNNGRSARRAWLMALVVAALVGATAAAAFWSGDETPPVAQLATDDPAIDVATIEEPEADLADTSDEADMIPPPEDEIVVEDESPASSDDGNVARESAAAIDTGSEVEPAMPRPADSGPATTASIDPIAPSVENPIPESVDPVVIAEPRLPRQRPEPPEGFVAPRPVPVVGMSKPVAVTPDVEPVDAAMLPSFDPMNPPPTLTPAEYQALLERRAWAADYAARRRALAESRAMDEPLGVPIIITRP